MFGTALSYVTLRLLGVGPDDPQMEAARNWVRALTLGLLPCVRCMHIRIPCANHGGRRKSAAQVLGWGTMLQHRFPLFTPRSPIPVLACLCPYPDPQPRRRTQHHVLG